MSRQNSTWPTVCFGEKCYTTSISPYYFSLNIYVHKYIPSWVSIVCTWVTSPSDSRRLAASLFTCVVKQSWLFTSLLLLITHGDNWLTGIDVSLRHQTVEKRPRFEWLIFLPIRRLRRVADTTLINNTKAPWFSDLPTLFIQIHYAFVG